MCSLQTCSHLNTQTLRRILLWVVVVLFTGACKKEDSIKGPNIVYILTDQWRASAFGYAGDPNVKTPHIDSFAKEAINFANAVSVSPVCTPHRAALLTGRYPTSTGMFLNDLYLPDEEVCMAEIFKAESYHTGFLGKWHLDGHGRLNNVAPERRQGFDYWKALECSHDYNKMAYYDNNDPTLKYWDTYSPYALAKDANNFIDESSKKESPFLLFISIATPHFPHESAPKKYQDLYPPAELTLAPNVAKEMESQIREELQGYYAHCSATDEAIGTILNKLVQLDLLEETIIVLTSDHGEMMGAHGIKPFTKQLAYDESIKVPFLIRHPTISVNKGAVIQAPINTPDILPTLLGLASLQIPTSIEGEDLSDLIKSPNEDVDRAALVMNICPFTREHVFPEYRAIRTKQYTYARTLEGPSKFFDNLNDPYQMTNLVDIGEYAKIQDDLDAKLFVELEKIGDEFHPREHYLQKWQLTLDSSNHAINYRDFLQGEGVVQSPIDHNKPGQ